MSSRRLGLLLLTVLIAVPVALVSVKLATGIGPDLPGPRLRERLGIVEGFSLCSPSPEGVRSPKEAIAGRLRWRRARVVQALADDEVRATSAGSLVYVGGGARPNGDGTFFRSLSSFFSFDPATGRVRRLPDLPIPLDHTTFGSWRGDVYVFGGRSNGKTSDRAFRYAPGAPRWTELARMPEPRLAGAGATVGDRFYFVGGALENNLVVPEAYRTMFVYSFRENRWRRAPSMPTGRHHVAATALGGELYVVGGRRNGNLSLPAAERFDPAKAAWERLPPLPLGSGGLGLVSLGGRVVAIAGGDDDEGWVTPATWSFDPATSNWTRLGDLNVPRHGFGATAAGGQAVVIGGSPCARTGRTAAIEVSSGPPF